MQHNPEFHPPVFHHGLPISLNRLSVSDKGYVQKKKQSGKESVHKFSPRLMVFLQVEWSFFNFMEYKCDVARSQSHTSQNTNGIIRFVVLEYWRYSGYDCLSNRSSQRIRVSPPRNNSTANVALCQDQWVTMPPKQKRQAAA